LGRGPLHHPAKDGLRAQLRDGCLCAEEYYRHLLGTVYRLLFRFVAAARTLPEDDGGLGQEPSALAALPDGDPLLLEAVRVLPSGADFTTVGAGQPGAVYESPLALQPTSDPAAPALALQATHGNERRTTGPFYTPASLIDCLLDSALDPLLDEACRRSDPAAALLALRACAPAGGCGHFRVAAARRIARRLAAVRSGEAPDPAAVRSALREVVGRCLYGVDVDPLAVELCRFAL